MSLQKQAGFDSQCPKCHTAIKKGDAIYKVDDHWCKNQGCPNSQQPTCNTSAAGYYASIHEEIWQFATQEAKKIKPIKQNEDANAKKDRDILAQVIYKKCFDFAIHAKKKPDTK